MSEYVYVCDDCLEIHEDYAELCESCGATTNQVHRDDLDL